MLYFLCLCYIRIAFLLRHSKCKFKTLYHKPSDVCILYLGGMREFFLSYVGIINRFLFSTKPSYNMILLLYVQYFCVLKNRKFLLVALIFVSPETLICSNDFTNLWSSTFCTCTSWLSISIHPQPVSVMLWYATKTLSGGSCTLNLAVLHSTNTKKEAIYFLFFLQYIINK